MGRDSHRASKRCQRLSRTCGGHLEGTPLVLEEGFHRFAEVIHEMEAPDDVHRRGGPLANAVRIERTAIPTDGRNRWMPGKPGRDGAGGALWEQVHDAMTHQID
jgi:hypothetical protein